MINSALVFRKKVNQMVGIVILKNCLHLFIIIDNMKVELFDRSKFIICHICKQHLLSMAKREAMRNIVVSLY